MKRLVICCDGTWNRADQQRNGVACPTNVATIASRIAKRAGHIAQIVYYDEGVGTGNLLDRLTGGALGHGLDDNLRQAYRFVVANYEQGDELYLFGFSRGAFTVRSLAGMIRKCGILQPPHANLDRRAVDIYRDREMEPGSTVPVRFREEYAVGGRDGSTVKFVGVWDTVGSLGIPLRGLRWLTRRKYQFHDVELSGIVQFAYQALAIDERRRAFEPTLWRQVPKPGQVMEQVWFVGVHSDVGGGYAERGLADVSLEWMMEKAAETGLAFDADVERHHPLAPDVHDHLHDSRRHLYRLAPAYDRPIGWAKESAVDAGAKNVPDSTQALHPSVYRRWERSSRYRPASLSAFFARGDGRLRLLGDVGSRPTRTRAAAAVEDEPPVERVRVSFGTFGPSTTARARSSSGRPSSGQRRREPVSPSAPES